MRRLVALWTKEWIALSRDLRGLAVFVGTALSG